LILAIGPVIRVSPTMLLVSDSKKLPEMYNRQSDKSEYYITPSFGPVPSVLITMDHKAHQKIRKLLAPHYSFTNIRKLEHLVDARATEWLSRIDEEFCKTKKAFNFSPWAV